MRHWYLSLCMEGVWSAGWIFNPTSRMTNTSVAQIQQFSPDDGHMDARNMQRRVINKYIKQNCAPSWIYLQHYSTIGQHAMVFQTQTITKSVSTSCSQKSDYANFSKLQTERPQYWSQQMPSSRWLCDFEVLVGKRRRNFQTFME